MKYVLALLTALLLSTTPPAEAVVSYRTITQGGVLNPWSSAVTEVVGGIPKGDLMILHISYSQTGCTVSTVVGLGVTWTLHNLVSGNGGVDRQETWRAVSDGQSGAITMTWTATCTRGGVYQLYAFSLVDTSAGSQGIVQATGTTQSVCSNCAITATVTNTVGVNNVIFGLCNGGDIGSTATFIADTVGGFVLGQANTNGGSSATFKAEVSELRSAPVGSLKSFTCKVTLAGNGQAQVTTLEIAAATFGSPSAPAGSTGACGDLTSVTCETETTNIHEAP